MAFEQTQKTRVESKQFTGDWSGFMTPSGNAGNATEPYYTPSQGIDLTPVANSIRDISNMYEKQAADNAKRSGGGSGSDDVSGQFLDEAYSIVELNTDSNGNLSAKGEEQMRSLRNRMAQAGLKATQMQSILSDVGQGYNQTLQGLSAEASRKHIVDQRKALADKALQLHPNMAGSSQEELAEVGKYYYAAYNAVGASLEAATNPNCPQAVKDASIKEITRMLPTLLSDDIRDRLIRGEVNANDELDVSNAITQSIMASGLVSNPRMARQIGVELSASIIGQTREYKTNMEKLSVDEKKRYLEAQEQDAKVGMFNNNPNLAFKASLVNWDFTKLPDAYIEILDKNFDATRFVGENGKRYWQGSFDAQTASFGCQNGSPLTCGASQDALAGEALNRNTPESASSVLDAMNTKNAENYLNKPGMEQMRGEAVPRLSQKYAGLMANQLRGMVRADTPYVPSEGKVLGGREEEANAILNNWKNAMRHIGMTDEEIIAVGKEAMSSLGVAIPTDTTNPEMFYRESVSNIERWMLENPIKSKIPFVDKSSSASVGVNNAMRQFMQGDISKEEALAMMSASMNELSGDIEEGTVNLEQTEQQPEVQQTPQGTFNMSELENQVLSSKEYRDVVNALAQDNTITREQKTEAAHIVFENLMQKAVGAAKELFGAKSANAGFVPAKENEIISIAEKNVMPIEQYVGSAYNDGQLRKEGESVDWKKNGNVTIGYGINLTSNPLTEKELDYFTINGKPLTKEDKEYYANRKFAVKDGDKVKLEITEPNARKLFKERFAAAVSKAKSVYEKATKGLKVKKFDELSNNIKFVIADIVFNAGKGNAESRKYTMRDLGSNAITKALNGMKKLGLAGDSRINMYRKLLLG